MFLRHGKWPYEGKAVEVYRRPLRLPHPPTAPVVVLPPSRPGGFRAVCCENCGEGFLQDTKVTGFPMRYCGDRCSKRAGRRRNRIAAQRFQVTDKLRMAVYERDGFCCQICDVAISAVDDYGGDWGPTLDHIIPQSATLVPDHSAANLRLAHRWCNSLRNDGQLADESVKARALARMS